MQWNRRLDPNLLGQAKWLGPNLKSSTRDKETNQSLAKGGPSRGRPYVQSLRDKMWSVRRELKFALTLMN